MSNAGQINNSSNNSQQKQPVWFWVVTVVSFQFLFGAISVLANLAQIADSIQGFCKEYDISMTKGVCNAILPKPPEPPKPNNGGNEHPSLPKLIFTKSKISDVNTDVYKEIKSDNMKQTSISETQIRFNRAKVFKITSENFLASETVTVITKNGTLKIPAIFVVDENTKQKRLLYTLKPGQDADKAIELLILQFNSYNSGPRLRE